MTTLPLHERNGYLFLEIAGSPWLLDTGSPTSFGSGGGLTIDDERFELPAARGGLTAEGIAGYCGAPCAGLLGADVLGRFDHLWDLDGGEATVSAEELRLGGNHVRFDDCLGVPILTASIGDRAHRMFFDTGAPISYLQDEALARFPRTGSFTDFYHGLGNFSTDTHAVPVSIEASAFTLRCGTLPTELGMALLVAGTRGIVGNEILRGRTVGYFPRRRTLVT